MSRLVDSSVWRNRWESHQSGKVSDIAESARGSVTWIRGISMISMSWPRTRPSIPTSLSTSRRPESRPLYITYRGLCGWRGGKHSLTNGSDDPKESAPILFVTSWQMTLGAITTTSIYLHTMSFFNFPLHACHDGGILFQCGNVTPTQREGLEGLVHPRVLLLGAATLHSTETKSFRTFYAIN